MKSRNIRFRISRQPIRNAIAILCVAALAASSSAVFGQSAPATAVPTSTADEVPKIPNDQLDSLVAPIALYPDELLSQTLVASTYPLEMIQLQQWLDRNKSLKGQALADAVQKQPWDPSIQAMVAVPDVVARLAGNIQWTTELGNAFLAQQEDVLAAIQRMRIKAQGAGTLVTTEQQTVETQVVEGSKQVIVIQQAKPEVIYVPSYDPVVVYGAPVYPYPSYIYPGYVPGMGLAFGAGIALGAAWGGGWGYHCGWGGGDVNVNINNSYVNNFNKVNNINNINAGNKWQHQPAHRGGAPYGDRGTANRFGGRTATQLPGTGRPGGIGSIGGAGGVGNRPGTGVGGVGGVGNRPGTGTGIGSGVGSRPGTGTGIGSGAGTRPGSGIGSGAGTRPGSGSGSGAGTRPGSGVGSGTGSRPSTKPATRPSGGSSVGSGASSRPTTKPATRPSSGNSIGSRSVSPSSSSSRSAFGGTSSSGAAARASSSRGASSMRSSSPSRSSGGGGGSRSGGGGRRR